MRSLMTLVVVLAACGDNAAEPMTFGDGAALIGEAFCIRDVECGGRNEAAIPSCIDSQIFQLCTQLWDCDEILNDEQVTLMEQCAEELAVRECSSQLPESCLDLFYE